MAKYDSKPVPQRVQNIIGNTYNRWTVVGYSHAERRAGGAGWRHYWIVRCQCGTVKTHRRDHFMSSQSCGCYRTEVSTERIVALSTTHGMSRTPIYQIWYGMRARCENAKDPGYSNYGGRGIKVCSRWRESFEAFYEDMGPRPSSRHTIERIDNTGNYTPGNCKWATYTQQANNKRNNILITFQGETLTLPQWARRLGVSKRLLYQRHYAGWDVERMLTEPPAAPDHTQY